jgi:hypothetical protein
MTRDLGLCLLGLLIFAPGCGGLPTRYGTEWSNLSLDKMVDEYGSPDRIENKRVVWVNRGPWKRIVVWDGMDNSEIYAGAANIEQTIAYLVPQNKRDALNDLDEGVMISADGSELSARSSSEERNFLALNLADEVIHGVRTPEQARSYYARTLRLAEAGKSSPYMKGLRFQPARP